MAGACLFSNVSAQTKDTALAPILGPKEGTSTGSESSLNENREMSYNQIHVHSFGIGLGETFLAGNFRDHGEDSITFDGLYNYSASHSFDLLVNAHYSNHKHQEEFTKLQGAVVSIKGKLYQFDAFSPFILGGLGFYRPKVKRYITVSNERKLAESRGKTAFGFNLGGGADLKLNNLFSIGVIGHYHNPFDVKQYEGPDVEGSYFKLLITLMYHL